LLALLTVGLAAGAGAWVYARYFEAPVVFPPSLKLYSANAEREGDYSRGQVEALASKVGDLQAKIIEMDGLSRRVAETAGVPYTDPEIQAGLDQPARLVRTYKTNAHGAVKKEKMSSDPSSSLDFQFDFLQQAVTRQKDWYRMMDMALTRRVGVEASLPS